MRVNIAATSTHVCVTLNPLESTSPFQARSASNRPRIQITATATATHPTQSLYPTNLRTRVTSLLLTLRTDKHPIPPLFPNEIRCICYCSDLHVTVLRTPLAARPPLSLTVTKVLVASLVQHQVSKGEEWQQMQDTRESVFTNKYRHVALNSRMIRSATPPNIDIKHIQFSS